MSRRNRYISLSEPERAMLRDAAIHHPKAEVRLRAQGLVLSHAGWKIKEVAAHFEVCVQTVSSWYDCWEKSGLFGLLRQKGQGRKAILQTQQPTHLSALKKAVHAHYQDVKAIQAELVSELKVEMSPDTVKRFLKKMSIPGGVSAAAPKPGKTRRNTKTVQPG